MRWPWHRDIELFHTWTPDAFPVGHTWLSPWDGRIYLVTRHRSLYDTTVYGRAVA